MKIAVSNHCYPQILAFIEKDVHNMKDVGFMEACRLGNMELVKFFIGLYDAPPGAWTLSHCLSDAAKSGKQEIVNFLIDKGADDWDSGMEGAAAGGHKHLIDFFISKGATDWNLGLDGAARNGSKDLIKFFIDKGADDMDTGLLAAAVGGHEKLLDYFFDRGATEYLNAMVDAAEAGKLNIVKNLLQSFAEDFTKDDIKDAKNRSQDPRVRNFLARILQEEISDTDTESTEEEDQNFIKWLRFSWVSK